MTCDVPFISTTFCPWTGSINGLSWWCFTLPASSQSIDPSWAKQWKRCRQQSTTTVMKYVWIQIRWGVVCVCVFGREGGEGLVGWCTNIERRAHTYSPANDINSIYMDRSNHQLNLHNRLCGFYERRRCNQRRLHYLPRHPSHH